MAKNFKKIITFLIILMISLFIVANSNLAFAKETSGAVEMLHELDPSSNFFTQVEDTTPIEITDKRASILADGYTLMAQNSNLELYFKAKTFGIAIYDKENGYTWLSTYERAHEFINTAAVQNKIDSGITLEYYSVDSKGVIKSAEISYCSKSNNKTAGAATVTKVDNGFDAAVDFASYGISFKVEIRIDGGKLTVSIPYESITEVTVGTLNPKNYKLKSIILFPYLGSENYEINGYCFIPDGSGALIRYNDHKSSTAYIKKLYGDDYSFTDYPQSSNIKENGVLSLPIYGVNHGYNQAAFLCQVEDGYGSAELHSYPYMYSLIPVNTSFFKYYVKDTFTVKMSTSTMTLLNEEPYPCNYKLSYTFLNGNSANYVGMANTYRESLGLDQTTEADNNIPLRLEFLGLDYKPGLFGKNFVKMTSFSEALDIIRDLEDNNVNNFNITYLGWNRGGYFTKGATNAKAAYLLGGKAKLKKLSSYISEKGYDIDYTVNPYVSNNYGAGSKNVKKIGLSPFEVTQKSSLEQTGYYVLPTDLASIINKKANRYARLGITNLKLDNLNVAYSYRYKANAVYRTQMIDQVANELSKLDGYKISAEKPNSYLLKYLTNYYSAFYESNKFIYETDSIPFMSILLSGVINQYMPSINYISDYDLAILRMIEYNIYPSFIITHEEAYDLRYTNYEYLNSTQYDLWKDLMIRMYTKTNDALSSVIGARLTAHSYVDNGVSKCSYSNGVTIYVNYNNKNVNVDGVSLTPYSYLVKGGN
ncbi:MAG: hypothetical protein J6X93_04860 [Bacilli bacterium]|nr:hypothetical protein [Bacilli bacterium]